MPVSETNLRTQWQNAVDILEQTRNFGDGTLAGSTNLFDVLEKSLEGEYTPEGLAIAVSRFRSLVSGALSSGSALEFLEPILREYVALISTPGKGYTDINQMARALYEHFAYNGGIPITVASRTITFDTSITSTTVQGGSIVGSGTATRLTEDSYGYDIEDCHVETKILRCVQDQNSGTDEHAELFEMLGEAASRDSLLRGDSNYGSGISGQFITSVHCGTGEGGSLLRNSSFSTYNASGSPKFDGWTETAGSANIAQVISNFFRSQPGASTDVALQITGGSGQVKLSQTLANMRVNQLDRNTPYYLQAMVNPTVGTASGGSFLLHLGSKSTTTTIASLSAGWNRIIIAADSNTWFRNFNQDGFTVAVEWDASSSSGTLLVDDVILVPYTRIDGTWWTVVGGATPWKLDDTLEWTDTGGAAGTGTLQWWWWVAGLGYLPSTTGTPTIADP